MRFVFNIICVHRPWVHRARIVVDVAWYRRIDHRPTSGAATTQVSNANQEIVAATRKNRRFLDTFWGLIQILIGFGTGAAPPIDRRSVFPLTPMVIEL